jgi:hypothetical protein
MEGLSPSTDHAEWQWRNCGEIKTALKKLQDGFVMAILGMLLKRPAGLHERLHQCGEVGDGLFHRFR